MKRLVESIGIAIVRKSQARFVAIVLSILCAAMVGCSSNRETGVYSASPPPTQAQPAAAQGAGGQADSDFSGVWQGTTLASCQVDLLPSRCNAQQNVTITLLPGPGSKLTGNYRCAYGNMDCYHANDTGKVISASTNGPRINLRIMMPDATSCMFTGLNVNQTINGGYTCYQGGSRLEQGSWRARRSY